MKIGIIGAGNIGRTLGKKWMNAGHDVLYGVRDPSKRIEADGNYATTEEAIQFGEVLLFAIPGGSIAEVATKYATYLNHKIIIDATNKMSEPIVNNLFHFEQHAPDAQLYRAFNSLGWENFEEPEINGEQADLLYCGIEEDSRSIIEGLIEDIGLNPVYVGGLDRAPLVDSLGLLWGALAYGQGMGRRLAFRVLSEGLQRDNAI